MEKIKENKITTDLDLNNFSKFRINFFLKVSLVTLINTLIFFLVGYLLDSIFNSSPILTIVFLIISYPVLQLILYKYVRKIIRK